MELNNATLEEAIQTTAQEAVNEQAEIIAETIAEEAKKVLTLDDIKTSIADLAQFVAGIAEQLGEVHGIVITIRDSQIPANEVIQVASAAIEEAEVITETAVEVINDEADEVENLDDLPPTIDNLPEPEVIETPAIEPQKKAEQKRKLRMI